jgi:hypothetical protein
VEIVPNQQHLAHMRALVWLALVTDVAGHGMLTVPAPRDGTQNAGPNKGGAAEPCGTATATAATPTVTLAAGAPTTVEWRLNAAHGGPCEIRIAATDDALAGTAPLETVGACNGQDSVGITVPAGITGNAVMQWYWDGDGPYYDCADITVTGGTAAAAGGAAASAAATGAAASGSAEAEPAFAEVEVVFSNDIADVSDEWETRVIRAVATNVGISASRIEIAEILPGSIRVIFRFFEDLAADASDDEDALSADDSAKKLAEQLDSGTGIMTSPDFECCYTSYEITQWASPGMEYLKWFLMFLLIAGAIVGALKFLKWKKEQGPVKAELKLRQQDKEAAAAAGDDVENEAKGGSSGTGDTEVSRPVVASAVPDAASALPAKPSPPPLEGLEGRFFAAAAASPSGEGGGGGGAGGGWGTMRAASRQIQSARTLGVMRKSLTG